MEGELKGGNKRERVEFVLERKRERNKERIH